MKFEHTEVWCFDHALRGMRNSFESWDKSDSGYENRGSQRDPDVYHVIGANDLALAQKLIKAGEPHRKFLRQIFVSVDITAPLYWWKEFDTYKVGTVANSTSTMHKLASTPITKDCFEMDDFEDCKFDKSVLDFWDCYLIPSLEQLRIKYNETKSKVFWKELIRLLPESWLQKRTVTMTYENVLKMIEERRNHRLTEWSESFMDWVKDLPHAKELLLLDQAG